MGGKNYFCDYCCCYMKNNINVRNVHNSGITHKIAKARYMRRFEDPFKVFEEERAKTPCTRYLKGYCKFDLFCHYGHYNEKQLEQLQAIGKRLAKKSRRKPQQQLHIPDYLELLPWVANPRSAESSKRKATFSQNQLPDSLRAINFHKIRDEHFLEGWG